MSQDLAWLDRIGSIDEAINSINRLGWNLIIGEVGQRWVVQSGEKLIFAGDSREAVNAFLYGMALAYSILPNSMIDDLRQEFGVEEDE